MEEKPDNRRQVGITRRMTQQDAGSGLSGGVVGAGR